MQFKDKLDSPKEHKLMLQGEAGNIEAILTVPDNANIKTVAFLGHPHSLQGGSMTNKVVTTMARVFRELHVPSLRFNFRGVGLSEGEYDAGIGESKDMLALVQQWQEELGQSKLIFAGFSFGSFVAYRAAAQSQGSSLITIAPSVQHYDYKHFTPKPNPWLIIQPEADEVVPPHLVLEFAQQLALPIISFKDTSHFFHGKLIALKDQLTAYLQDEVLL